ncbi:GIP [Symbiodinium natans]|uniref:GIP protein n=1 Tax=Symbiodinium natans TaxID=878477 RepID=A0A812SE67_9DINO|nr:GIP [Symbiodinium natans]
MPSVQRLLEQPGVLQVTAEQCRNGLVSRSGQQQRKAASLLTNNRRVAEALGRGCQGKRYPSELVGAILQAYSRTVGKAPQEIDLVEAASVAREDLQRDQCYFFPEELEEMDGAEAMPLEEPEEIGHREEVPPAREMMPEAFGVTEDMLKQVGWKKLDTGAWMYLDEHTEKVNGPEPGHEAWRLPWRTSWTWNGADWSLLEDEVRWQDKAQDTRLQPNTRYLSIYQARLDQHADRHMRHFPGMARVTLERMIRKAHEGLGHPEHGRFLRILRQSKASEEVIEAAKQFRCSTCEAYQLPDPARKGAPPKEELFINEWVGVDTVHLRDHQNQAVPALNIIDFHTHFQLVIPMDKESAAEVRKAYRQWVRFFGVPRKVMFDLGTEFKAEFRRQVENDGSEALPSSLETPTQRGLTERAGGVFKNILYKSMLDYQCQSREEWKELVDVACMTRNRLLLRGGYSPIQRVIGYTPRLPGGLLTGGADDHTMAGRIVMGDRDVTRSMKMRKAAAVAFHESDCDQALRAATLAGPRKLCDFEVGQAVYFWRRGAGSTKKTRQSYWTGPGRIVMTSLPNAIWIAYSNTLIKAAPERVRHATAEENMSISGWLRGISKARQDFEKLPKKGFVDLTGDYEMPGELEDDLQANEPHDDTNPLQGPEPVSGVPPLRRVRQKTGEYEHAKEPLGPPPGLTEPPTEPRGEPEREQPEVPALEPVGPLPFLPGEELFDRGIDVDENENHERGQGSSGASATGSSGFADNKRGPEDREPEPPGKRSRVHLLEVYALHLQTLARARQKKEVRATDFKGADAVKLQRAILKEINNNLGTRAYELLSSAESEQILREKPEKVMESRYVLTKKPLEPAEVAGAESEGLLLNDDTHGPCKAKCRHVMKGYSEESALDVESTTPQINRDTVIFLLQVLASLGWDPGFLDFTQAFHSGDAIKRELYCKQPKEGIPGAKASQLLRLLKTCYGLTDGPYAWYQHLDRKLRQLGYKASQADPCLYFLHGGADPETPELEGVIGVATDDLLHGGNERHWANIASIAAEHKLGKNQRGTGRFTGKDIELQADGSIKVSQAFYVKEKIQIIALTRKRKQQRYSKCTPQEIEALRSSLGVLSWLSKETRCDIAGRVALLQQAFPEPRVQDLVEANKISEEARKYAHLGIKVMPIAPERLRISVVTDAAWGNTRDQPWIEDHPDDYWEETEGEWVRHHVQPRRTTFHPGAAPGGPDLHSLDRKRQISFFAPEPDGEIKSGMVEDDWSDGHGIRVLQDQPWTGRTVFNKCHDEKITNQKIHSSLAQLQNLSSQGGQIILYHDRSLSETEQPAMATVASWKSYRLKRKTVDTLAAEGQALQAGLGSIHWHRLLFMEAFYGMLSASDWREVAGRLPFLAAVDSKSLFDAVNKCACTASYVSDKRTAIDLAVIKADLAQTGGTIRWIDTRSMLSDPLTKQHPGTYLRYVLDKGFWAIAEEGHALQAKALEREARRFSESMKAELHKELPPKIEAKAS